MLERSFEELQFEENFDKRIKLGVYLAYLLEIDPSLWHFLQKSQEDLFKLGVTCLNKNIDIPTA